MMIYNGMRVIYNGENCEYENYAKRGVMYTIKDVYSEQYISLKELSNGNIGEDTSYYIEDFIIVTEEINRLDRIERKLDKLLKNME